MGPLLRPATKMQDKGKHKGKNWDDGTSIHQGKGKGTIKGKGKGLDQGKGKDTNKGLAEGKTKGPKAPRQPQGPPSSV